MTIPTVFWVFAGIGAMISSPILAFWIGLTIVIIAGTIYDKINPGVKQ